MSTLIIFARKLMNVLVCMFPKRRLQKWPEAQVKTLGEYQNTKIDAL